MFRPIEYIADPEEWAELRQNPRKPSRKALFSNFMGLEIKLALVRAPNYDAKKRPVVDGPGVLVNLIQQMELEPVEMMLSVPMDSRHKILGVYVAARGGVAEVVVSPAELVRPVLMVGATRFIIVHNHPSGDAELSPEDKLLTNRVRQAGDVLGITLLDHIVVGHDDFSTASAVIPEILSARLLL